MKVELFLRDINQDIIKKPKELRRVGVNPEEIQWTKECCIGNCCIFKSNSYRPDDVRPGDFNKGLILRKERFGGLLWDSTTGKVFKLDSEAYNLFKDIEKSESIDSILEKHKLNKTKLRTILKKVGKASDKC